MSPTHSHEDNVTGRGGREQPLLAGRDEGKGEEEGAGPEGGGSRATPSIFAFGSSARSYNQCLSAYDAMKTAFQAGGSCSQGRV